jgi:hypothetical protein
MSYEKPSVPEEALRTKTQQSQVPTVRIEPALETKEHAESTSLHEAREIMKEGFFGATEVAAAWGIELNDNDIPPIPYSQTELKEAISRNEILILRMNSDAKGKPLTMKRMSELMAEKLKSMDQQEIFGGLLSQYESAEALNRQSFSDEVPRVLGDVKGQWSLVGKEPIKDSERRTYAEQTKVLRTYVMETLKIPANHPDLTGSDDDHLDRLQDKIGDSETLKKSITLELINLPINQKYRRTPAEVSYDLFTVLATTGKRLLPEFLDSSNRTDSEGLIVRIGNFSTDYLHIDSSWPSMEHFNVRMCFTH